MLPYYILLAVLCAVGIPCCCLRPNNVKKLIFAGVSFFALAGMSAIRYSVGYDYSYVYAPNYESFLRDPFGATDTVGHEWGFVLLERITAFCSQNYQMLFVVTSVLIIGLLIFYYWQHSENLFCSVFLFVVLSQFYCTMNFIRQSLAMAITLFAFPFLQKKKLLPYLLIVGVAAFFHKSALILIPFYFVNLIPITLPILGIYLGVTLFLYLSTEKLFQLLTQFFYQEYQMDNIHMNIGFSWVFTIAAFVLFLLIFMAKILDQKEKKDRIPDVYVSYAFFTFFFILLGTKHSVVDRFSIYFEYLLPVILPTVFVVLGEKLPTGKTARRNLGTAVVTLSVFLLTLGYHQYALVKDHHGVVPYQVVFTQPFYSSYQSSLKGEEPELEPDQEPSDEPAEPGFVFSSSAEDGQPKETVPLLKDPGMPQPG